MSKKAHNSLFISSSDAEYICTSMHGKEIFFSFTGSLQVNSILSEKEENSKTCISQTEENNQMVLFVFWCGVSYHVQAATYQVKEYLKPHELVLHGQMKLGKNIVLTTMFTIDFMQAK